jgi:hypothetical protein
MRPMRTRCLALFLSLASSSLAGQAGVTVATPARNWVLPLFTPEGWRSMTLRGSAVHPVGTDRIDVVDINITTFSGDASAHIDSSLLSAAASFFPAENRASGPDTVRLIRYAQDGGIAAEITGEDWTYRQEGKRVSINRNAHVVFRELLSDILK